MRVAWLIVLAFASLAHAQKTPPENVRRFLADREAELKRIESQWRNDFAQHGLLPVEMQEVQQDTADPFPVALRKKTESLGLVDPAAAIEALETKLKETEAAIKDRSTPRTMLAGLRAESRRLTAEIRKASAGKEQAAATYQAKMAERRASLESALAEHRRTFSYSGISFYGKVPPQLQVGQIGRFILSPRPNIRVRQVLGPEEALVAYQRIDGKTYPMFLLRGFSTAGWADDTEVKFTRVGEVTGTHSYETAGGGTNTVFVVEPFDVAAAEKFLGAEKD